MAVSTRCHKPDKCSIKMHLITMRQRERDRERERERERERDRERERERERERKRKRIECVCVCVCDGGREDYKKWRALGCYNEREREIKVYK